MQKLTLGQKIKFKVVYERYSKRTPWKTGDRTVLCGRMLKYWQKIEIPEQKGIVIGLRTLSNGLLDYDSEEGYSYERKESVNCVLVSTSLRTKIVKVPLEDIII